MNTTDYCAIPDPREDGGKSEPQAEKAPRQPGAQPGNSNAVKHGYYCRRIDAAQKQDLIEAEEVEGLDAEIALLRSKIQLLNQRDPENIKLIIQAINTLSNVMVRRRYVVRDKNAIAEAVKQVLKGVILPAGIIRDALEK